MAKQIIEDSFPTSAHIKQRIVEVQDLLNQLEKSLSEQSLKFEEAKKSIEQQRVDKILKGEDVTFADRQVLNNLSLTIAELETKVNTYKQALQVLDLKLAEAEALEIEKKKRFLLSEAERLIKANTNKFLELEDVVKQINDLRLSSCSISSDFSNLEVYHNAKTEVEKAMRALKIFFGLEDRGYFIL
ncbi:MAG TPA: hypothetical protein PKE38_12260 [Ignavibacteriaceae bacterium]|nr:hypothetical protein [Ignavibacteriaceae bacterium]